MKLTVGICSLVVCTLVPLARLTAQGPPAAQATPCASVTDVTVACGQQGPEDLYALPNGQWVVTSVLAGGGGINVIRVSDRTSTRLYPSPSAKNAYDAKQYPGCPGPPGASDAQFRTHGLWLDPKGGATRRLYAVGHGARESVEVFNIDTGAATPVLTWIGCAVAPDPIGLNSVVGLPDGGFIASNYLPRGGAQNATQRMMTGEKNGELWEWHAQSGWQKVPGSEASGANGLDLSDDGKTLYIAGWGSQSFIKLSRGKQPVDRTEIPLGFRVDNLHRAKDGSLLAAGQGQGTSDVVKIDPKTLKVTKLLQRRDDASFRGGTVAVEVGDRLWVGSYGGDRIALLTP
jgi:DNA-binding beta-propeller fold protein YncE